MRQLEKIVCSGNMMTLYARVCKQVGIPLFINPKTQVEQASLSNRRIAPACKWQDICGPNQTHADKSTNHNECTQGWQTCMPILFMPSLQKPAKKRGGRDRADIIEGASLKHQSLTRKMKVGRGGLASTTLFRPKNKLTQINSRVRNTSGETCFKLRV